jgi:serine/threonine protein kinase
MYATAGMSKGQIAAAIAKSEQQGWSEVVNGAGDGAGSTSSGLGVDDQVLWEQLKRREDGFFRDIDEDDVKLGRAIAEGGQALIYEADIEGRSSLKYVAKVYKSEGFSLADLQRQWPLVTKVTLLEAVLELSSPIVKTHVGEVAFGTNLSINCSSTKLGTFLKDGRFAFVMPRYWGDLRTLINLKMEDKNNQGPPFSELQACKIMYHISKGMRGLHFMGVLHRDLKAANVLISMKDGDPRYSEDYYCDVADYESSMLVQGTGFWRAPEVLEELLKKPHKRKEEIWTESVDVYSFAMTSYEVLTGRVPFYGYEKRDWKGVIDGERPHLPDYIDLELRELVERCWHKLPAERPNFIDLVNKLHIIEHKFE